MTVLHTHAHVAERDIHSPETAQALPTGPTPSKNWGPSQIVWQDSGTLGLHTCPLSGELPEGATHLPSRCWVGNLRVSTIERCHPENTDWRLSKEPLGFPLFLFCVAYAWPERSLGVPSFESAKLWGCENP